MFQIRQPRGWSVISHCTFKSLDIICVSSKISRINCLLAYAPAIFPVVFISRIGIWKCFYVADDAIQILKLDKTKFSLQTGKDGRRRYTKAISLFCCWYLFWSAQDPIQSVLLMRVGTCSCKQLFTSPIQILAVCLVQIFYGKIG